MAKLRHIAVTVPDPEAAARFYQEVFGLTRVGTANSATATGVYLTDGTINLALLRYRTEEAAGADRGLGFVGAHHFGFVVDDLAETRAAIEARGGAFGGEVGRQDATANYEQKYRDPSGVLFDVSHKPWLGATD